jgi:hypothetical protein
MVGWEIFSQLTWAWTERPVTSTSTSRACAIPSRCQIRAASDKAHNLGAVVANFRSAGARCIMGDVRFSALAGAGQVTSPR